MDHHITLTFKFPDALRFETVSPTELAHINQKLDKIIMDLSAIQAQNTALIAAVKEEDTVIDGAIVALNGVTKVVSDLQTQLAAAIAANDPAAIQAVSDSMAATVADITDKTKKLADAIATVPAA